MLHRQDTTVQPRLHDPPPCQFKKGHLCWFSLGRPSAPRDIVEIATEEDKRLLNPARP